MNDPDADRNGVAPDSPSRRRLWLGAAVAVGLFAGWYVAHNNSGNNTSSAVSNTQPVIKYNLQ